VSTNWVLALLALSGLLQVVGIVMTAWQVITVFAGRTSKFLNRLNKIIGSPPFSYDPRAGATSQEVNVHPWTAEAIGAAHQPIIMINGRTDERVSPVVAVGVVLTVVGVIIGTWAAAAAV
jgi:hypothetical protein